MKRTIKMFYLRNYRGIHHIINILSMVFFLTLFGFGDLFTLSPIMLIVQMLILWIVYKWTEFSMKLIDYHKAVSDELEKELKNDK